MVQGIRTHLTRIAAMMLLTGCASARQSVYAPMPTASVETWNIDFSYESRVEATTESNDGQATTTNVRTGRSVRHLQLRDDIAFELRDKHSIKVDRNVVAGRPTLQLNPIDFRSGDFRSVDVVAVDASGEAIGRVRVQNSDRNCCVKSDRDFADFAAKKIAELIRSMQSPAPR